MSESRILVLDQDMDRAERVATLLEFMDFNPRIITDAADVDLKKARGSDWVAVVVGDTGNAGAWDTFVEWLGKQALHPPLLVLPGRNDDAPWRARCRPGPCGPGRGEAPTTVRAGEGVPPRVLSLIHKYEPTRH